MKRIICTCCYADVTALVGQDKYGGCASCRSFGTMLLMIPTIHLNGTSKERLIDGLCEVSEKIDIAYSMLKQMAPNGRDYYPQGPTALAEAEGEHHARLKKLEDVRKEIDAMVDVIFSQTPGI